MAPSLPKALQELVDQLSGESDHLIRAKRSTELLEELQNAIAATKIIRQKSIKALDKSGMTYEEIGTQLGITKGRVYQIIEGQSGTTGKYYPE